MGFMKESWKQKIKESKHTLNNISSVSTPTEEFSLTYLYAVLLATVLEDSLLQIKLLTECSNELRVMKTMADMSRLLAKKFDVKQAAVVDELAGIDAKKLWGEEYKLDKLFKDRKLVTDTLLKTYQGLIKDRCYRHIIQKNTEIDKQIIYRDSLMAEEAKNKALRRENVKQLRLQRNHHKTLLYDIKAVIDKLKQEIEDASINSEARSRYITNWERARTEQHIVKLTAIETPPLDTILTCKRKLDDEHRIHSEITLLANIHINESLAEVDKMMIKYDTDMESIELKLQRMNIKYDETVARRIELEETYAKHEQLARDWQSFKDERERVRLYRERMSNAAHTVQAWWRGLLVRNQLGPYKPTRKTKAKPKEKPKK